MKRINMIPAIATAAAAQPRVWRLPGTFLQTRIASPIAKAPLATPKIALGPPADQASGTGGNDTTTAANPPSAANPITPALNNPA